MDYKKIDKLINESKDQKAQRDLLRIKQLLLSLQHKDITWMKK